MKSMSHFKDRIQKGLKNGISKLFKDDIGKIRIGIVLIIVVATISTFTACSHLLGFGSGKASDKIALKNIDSDDTEPGVNAELMSSILTEKIGQLTESREIIGSSLNKFYEARNFEPAWVTRRGLVDHARVLVQDLCSADESSLLPASYDPSSLHQALVDAAENPSKESFFTLDIELSRAFMMYADDHLSGRIDPKELPYENFIDRSIHPLDSVLAQALTTSAPKSFSTSMHPGHEHYRRLVDALEHYRELQQEGGWSAIQWDSMPEVGSLNSAVPSLRERLLASGDLEKGNVKDSLLYDEKIAEAVGRFQKRHGLTPDSLVGAATLEALNVPIEERISQIERNIERWLWMPDDLGDKYILVNIPGFELNAYENKALSLNMRVIVGSGYNEQNTPVFKDNIEYLVFRPYWNVPEDIAIEEIAPKALEDETFLARNEYELVDGTEAIEPDEEALEHLMDGEFRVRQRPGPLNSLGLIKFMFPNQHAIYLHDTPADDLFDRQIRDLSHGCIRLEYPAQMAAFVLSGQSWSDNDIQEALYEGERQEVYLEKQIPVYLMYLTTFVDEDGTVHFFDDVYEYDRKLASVLDQRKGYYSKATPDSASLCQALERFL